MSSPFKTTFAENIFYQKYAHDKNDTWSALAKRLVDDVCGSMGKTKEPLLSKDECRELVKLIEEMKFIPGGRYLYYAGRDMHAFNNCYLLKGEEDTREEWGRLMHRASDCLMLGGGIGVDYSVFREKDAPLKRTGGKASGPIPLMKSINEVGRNVMQGGSRRSAIYASLNWRHGDADDFLVAKNWHGMPIGKVKKSGGQPYTLADAKRDDFNFPAPLDMTNISLNYDDAFLESVRRGNGRLPASFVKNCEQALSTAEPGFSFNFGAKQNETLRNAPVSGDTWVMTSHGYEQIRDVVGKEICVWTGQRWAMTKFTKTKENASIIKVRMTGRRDIKAEPSHEFLVERWEGKGKARRLVNIDRVAASDLKIGDTLHVSLPKVTSALELDSHYYTLGFLFGDGSFGDRGSDLTLCTPEKKACFDRMDKRYIKSYVEEDARGYLRAYFGQPFSSALYSKQECPSFSSWSYAASFIAGLFDADGSYDSTYHRVRLSSAHFEFLQGVRRVLDFLGIRSFINKGSKSGYSGNETWMLVVSADSISDFAKIVPCKRLEVEGFTAYRAAQTKVTDLFYCDNEDVYCCDVGVEEHSFCAEGVIISNCTEVTSEDDSDVCNLGSLNMGAFNTLQEFRDAVVLATKFLLCGTLRATLPYDKVYEVREKNRRLGLGLMGVHEWLLQRGHGYEVVPDLHEWLAAYRDLSTQTGLGFSYALGVSPPVAFRAIAPTGTIGILAATTTGIEPLISVAYKRRYLTDGTRWKYEYVVDATADYLIRTYDVDPASIETAYSLANNVEKRVKFQADVQDYVDMAISSTVNLPEWGSELNNPDTVLPFARTLAKYAPRLRGFTCYPNGSRGGQPITEIDYTDAVKHKGVVFDELDICDLAGKGGSCGL